MIETVKEVLLKDERVVFAYIYGSFLESDDYRDLDIAVYSVPDCNPFGLSADIKVALYKRTGMPADFFDIRVINEVIEKGNIFSLLYLKQIFEKNRLLADKDFEIRSDFIEKYSMKYRSCEGLIAEVLR